MDELRRWINESMFRSDGALNAKRCRKEWFEKYDKIDVYQKICEKTSFLNKYDSLKFSERLWYILNDVSEPVLCDYGECDNKPDFFSINEGYRYDFCCNSHAQKSERVREKMKQTRRERYGVDHHLKKRKFLDKQKETVKDRYGVENVSQAEEIKEKKRETCRKNFGVDYAFQSEEVRKKSKKTLKRDYGVENVMKNENIKNKSRNIRLEKVFERKIQEDNKLGNEVEPLFGGEDFQGVDEIHKFYCNKCESEFEGTLDNPRCYNCYPSQNTSQYEKEVFYFLDDKLDCEVENNNWSVLEDKELDIFIPDKNVAVEFNGLYYHSEEFGNKSKYYHLEKKKECEERDVRLIQVFEDEWMHNKDTVKSKLMYIFDKGCTIDFIPYLYMGVDKVVGYVDKSWEIFDEWFEKNGFDYLRDVDPVKWGVKSYKRSRIFEDVKFTVWDCGYKVYSKVK